MDTVQEVFTAQATSYLPSNSSSDVKISAPVNQEYDDGTGPNGVFYCVIAWCQCTIVKLLAWAKPI